MRILVALEDDYRLYREMLVAGLRIKRPSAEVESAPLGSLGEELERFDPRVIICSGYKDVRSNGGRVWIELYLGTAQPAKVITANGGGYEVANPTLAQLLEVIDEFE
jgi:hypothetical protein